MKSPNEVSAIVGITRKALRGYVDRGLVTPTVVDDNGYQHFDDDAIRRIILAKVFLDAGYTRSQTKMIFDSDETVLAMEYDKLIEALYEKQKRTAGQIRMMRLLKIEAQLSDAAQEALDSINPVDTYQDNNFTSCLDRLTTRLSDLAGEIDSYDLDAYLLFWFNLIAVGLVSKVEAKPELSAELTKETFGNFCALMEHLDGFSGDFEQLALDKKIELFKDFVNTYFGDDELVHEIEVVCGDGSSEAIIQAVHLWVKSESK